MKIPALFLLIGLGLGLGHAAAQAQALPGESLYHLQASLVDQHGRPLQWAQLRGRPKLVSMFYAQCRMTCPLIIESAKNVQSQLPPAERARLDVVMVTLDPAHDTAAVLDETARRHRAPADWRFLRPGPDDVRAIASVLGVKYRPREDGSINHTSVLVLLDADGVVRARTEVAGIAAEPAFVAEVKALLANPQ